MTSSPHLYTLRNAAGMRVTISALGGTLRSWRAPDRYHKVADVLLGFPDEQGYAANAPYFGALIGRCANRIAGAGFTLDGVRHQLERNEGEHHLHGGRIGLHLARWQAEPEDGGLLLRHVSPDGEGGYPGNLELRVRYRLDDDGSLRIDYQASTDAPTPVSLSSHGYFNLNGGVAGIGDHLMRIAADRYLPVDGQRIPLGQPAPVAGSAFDFRRAAPIGARLGWPEPQLAQGGGFDHCYCLGPAGDLREVAWVCDPASGRELTVSTTEAGLQFYTGNFLAGVPGRAGRPYAIHDGFCLEAQAFPNQINSPAARAVVLRPGQLYQQTTVYRLAVQAAA
ncbi:aldose epimerase family protein [Rugamonas apoptosis]|nr:aldose epimerase family protein [Rugamonas apoptosis]